MPLFPPPYSFSSLPFSLSTCDPLVSSLNGTRGEFSFFIAQEASDEDILETEDYSAVVWALLLSSIAAPVFFRRVLAKDDARRNDRKKEGNEGAEATASRHVEFSER